MRPILVAAVCSAGAALVLILGELASLGATHHVGASTNKSAPATQSPGQLSSGESVLRGTSRFDQMGWGNDTPTDDQSTAEASPKSDDGQSALGGLVQQALSNAAPPVTLGPLGH
jgi:hypothetical protein